MVRAFNGNTYGICISRTSEHTYAHVKVNPGHPWDSDIGLFKGSHWHWQQDIRLPY